MKKFLLASLLCLLILTPLRAAQLAIVQSSRAVIYADIELKSPIGYVRKGKQLAVGEVKRRRGEILPVAVNGRIAWVRVQDLILPESQRTFETDNKKVTEHEVIIEENAKDPLNMNNYITLRTGPSSMALTAGSAGEEGSLDLTTAAETSLMFDHKNPYRSIHWGVGLEYFQGELGLFNFRTLNLKGGFAWVPIRLSLLSLEAYANLVLSGDFRVASQDIGEYKGNMYGLDYGVALRLFPESKFGVVFGAGITQYRLAGLNEIQNIQNDSIIEVKSLTGSKVFAGLSLRFQ